MRQAAGTQRAKAGATATEVTADTLMVRAMPVIFVVLWATGFIGARLTMPHAEPMTFLALRFGLVTVVLGGFAFASGASWRMTPVQIAHLAVAGLLVQAIYLGGVFAAVRLGVEAGTSALIVGIQPLVTAALAGPFLGEVVGLRKWAGLGIGTFGVVLVVSEKMTENLGTPAGVVLCIMALLGISAGTIYQKRFCQGVPIRTGNVVQFAAATAGTFALALPFETMAIDWTGEFVFGLVWLTIILSCGAVSLLYILIKRGAAANVASLFFLVPPVAALMGWVLFGETFGLLAVAGMACVAAGVILVNLRPRTPTPPHPAPGTRA